MVDEIINRIEEEPSLELEQPELDSLGTEVDSEPEEQPIQQGQEQPNQPQEFKEMVSLETPQGFKLMLGSFTYDVSNLSVLAINILEHLSQKPTKEKEVNYV
jgi:hypothetical protein